MMGSYALCAGFQINELSAPIKATALASAATLTQDASSQIFNPALLSQAGTQIYLGGSWIMPKIGFDAARGEIAAPDQNSTEVSGIRAQNDAASDVFIPAVYASVPLGFLSPDLTAGLSIDSQWGLDINYPDDWVGRYSSVNSSIRTLDITPAFAYQINSQLSIGAGINLQHLNVALSNDTITLIPVFGSSIAADSFNDLQGSSWSKGYVLGILYSPDSNTQIGLGYRTKIKQNISGRLTGNINSIAGTPVNFPITGTGNATLTIPAVINVGISEKLGNGFILFAGAQYTMWSSLKNLNINANANYSLFGNPESQNMNLVEPFNWHNSWLYSLGGQYTLNSHWVLLGGLAYDETPTNHIDRNSRTPDSNREWLSFGTQYALSSHVLATLAYTHIFMHQQSIDSAETPVAGQSTYYTHAQYSGNINVVAAGVSYGF